jgi:hypothetical protein
MSTLPPRPCPDARLLAPEEPAPEGARVWVYEGTLERFVQTGERYRYRQRIAWPEAPTWEQVRTLGLWMVERLSINGHVLVGLRARPEDAPAHEAQPIVPG